MGVGITLLAAHSASADTPKHTKDSLDKVRKALKEKKALLVDVREKKEWDAGHLEVAKLVPLSDLSANADDDEYAKKLAKKLPRKKILYLHCRSGGRVLRATPILKKFGYDVRPLKPGYESLLKAGFKKAKK
ncbi:MAG: rhodanese [Planctomycetaceae bacterium]|nr:rhodanese [Planctomycetaceae bacterium]